ncbi:hypothetical protein [Aliiglaciecola sp. LCG003]|uniref:hypothetical protein n=1 Tax=Aliiglaciecola sp. LCG003 TaxID=3053655 RepID=UPI0025738676|nr:hypothetical protein [Aliiglaciecola sp. LCG003]WJG09830.1 hypothetical protein QR722_01990 [Aliiglaciecola sp. LCG003]
MLDSQLEIVQQAKQFLQDVTQHDYICTSNPHSSGSAGAHMRHIIDHYTALISGVESGIIDYNKRDRLSNLETCPVLAKTKWDDIEHWFLQHSEVSLQHELQVISEISITQAKSVQVTSTLGRELVFVANHAIHHFFLLAVLRSLQGKSSPNSFGIAPATATFDRKLA